VGKYKDSGHFMKHLTARNNKQSTTDNLQKKGVR